MVHSTILDASLVNHHVVHMKSESAIRGRCGCGTQPTWRLFFGLMVPPAPYMGISSKELLKVPLLDVDDLINPYGT